MRSLVAGLTVLIISASTSVSQVQLDLVLPTNNDALFREGGPQFYQYVERVYKGVKSTPWEGGQYGFVRDPAETSEGVVYTRFHEGIDIRCIHRDANNEVVDQKSSTHGTRSKPGHLLRFWGAQAAGL